MGNRAKDAAECVRFDLDRVMPVETDGHALEGTKKPRASAGLIPNQRHPGACDLSIPHA